MSDELVELLRDGTLRGVRCGMTKDEVRAILGDPPAEGAPHRVHALWRYGRLEITFLRDAPDVPARVAWITLFTGSDRGPQTDAGRPWLDAWPVDLERAAVERLLAGHGLDAAPEAAEAAGPFTALRVLRSGAHLLFDEESGGRLERVTVRGEAPPAARRSS